MLIQSITGWKVGGDCLRNAFALLIVMLCVSATTAVENTSPSGAIQIVPLHGSQPTFDLQAFIDKQLQLGKQRIVIPPGKYRVVPKQHIHLAFKHLKDISIIADNVEMICTQTTRAVDIADCENLSIRGLTIDYDPLTFTQGRITALSADKSLHTVALFPGYPKTDQLQDRYQVYDPVSRTLVCPVYAGKLVATDPMHFQFFKAGHDLKAPEQVGDLVVVSTGFSPDGFEPHTIVISESKHITLNNVTVYGSNCFTFFEFNCDGNIYDHCVLDRCPPNLDLTQRDARLRSGNADAFHSKHAVVGPHYLSCVARYQGDDCVNICGDYHMITESHGNTLRVLANHVMNIAPGDVVELCSYYGERLPDATVSSVKPDGSVNSDEKKFLLTVDAGNFIRTGWNPSAFTITLDRSVSLPCGSVICSTRHTGNGFVVKDCTFGFNRSRGILIKASDGEVTGNTITGTIMSAILVSPEYWWLEAGSSNNVRISHNTISNCFGIPIEIIARGGAGVVAPAGAHRNITVESNQIAHSAAPAIKVTSTDAITIRNNSGDLIPFSIRDGTPPAHGSPAPAIVTENCIHVVSESNSFVTH